MTAFPLCFCLAACVIVGSAWARCGKRSACGEQCAGQGGFSWSCSCGPAVDDRGRPICKDECTCGTPGDPATGSLNVGVPPDAYANCSQKKCSKKCKGSYHWSCDNGADSCECRAPVVVTADDGVGSCNKDNCARKCTGGGYSWKCDGGVETCTCRFATISDINTQSLKTNESSSFDLSNSNLVPASCNPQACRTRCNGSYRWSCENGIDSCECSGSSHKEGGDDQSATPICDKEACKAQCNGAYRYICNNGVQDCTCLGGRTSSHN